MVIVPLSTAAVAMVEPPCWESAAPLAMPSPNALSAPPSWIVVVPPSTAPPAEAPRSWSTPSRITVVLFEVPLTDTTSIAPAEIVVWLTVPPE